MAGWTSIFPDRQRFKLASVFLKGTGSLYGSIMHTAG